MTKKLLPLIALTLMICGACSKKNDSSTSNPSKLSVTGFSPSSAKEGATVTITGTNFGTDKNNIAINFGGYGATVISSISNTEIKVEVPVQAQTGKIQVLMFGADTDSTKNNFTVEKSWLSKADFGGGIRNYAVAVTIGSKVYAGLGADGVSAKTDWWEYDAAGDTWTRKADFPGGQRNGASAFAIGTKGYVSCGQSGNTLQKDCWEYDPATNKWTRKTDVPGVARYSAYSFASVDKGYLVSGYIGTASSVAVYTKEVWEYTPGTDKWTQKKDFPGVGRFQGYGFTISGINYIGGGAYLDNTQRYREQDDLYAYNATTDTWTSKAGLGLQGFANTGFDIGTKGYIVGGYSSEDYGVSGSSLLIYSASVFGYDPATNTWKRASYLPGFARSSAFGFSVSGRGFVATGYGSAKGAATGVQVLKDVYEFVPAQ